MDNEVGVDAIGCATKNPDQRVVGPVAGEIYGLFRAAQLRGCRSFSQCVECTRREFLAIENQSSLYQFAGRGSELAAQGIGRDYWYPREINSPTVASLRGCCLSNRERAGQCAGDRGLAGDFGANDAACFGHIATFLEGADVERRLGLDLNDGSEGLHQASLVWVTMWGWIGVGVLALASVASAQSSPGQRRRSSRISSSCSWLRCRTSGWMAPCRGSEADRSRATNGWRRLSRFRDSGLIACSPSATR